ncbi:cyclic GMP-AMP synthase-like receptor [Anastrepha obliqua]|uniref:cyclic GMP-AMP synthase-like receptor n=1 Tax=Anastrepha obliqua TaxID=95512 RepID=UPI002409719F|nr:cyclic GMP-AMP synthase-like receptor [Anastrepha obliqua]
MSINFEDILKVINQFINIKTERRMFMLHYQALRDKLFENLKLQDPVFKKLFNGHQLQGSYGDNVKVNHADEYDLVFFLNFPASDEILVTEDPDMPGNFFIDMKNVLEAIRNQKQNALVYEKLQTMTVKENDCEYLDVEKLHSWLKSCFDKALLVMKSDGEGVPFNLKFAYQRCGPAHTVTVSEPCTFSVDFVPGIVLGPKHIIMAMSTAEWHGIPKPITNTKSFRASYYAMEQELMKNKNNLKNALRIMKKFRDSHPNMNNLKSYYIKTLFLWKSSQVENHYWERRLCDSIKDMFCLLKCSLDEGHLGFFWNKKLNLFNALDGKQLREMRCYINCVYEEILVAHDNMHLCQPRAEKIINLFLNRDERKECLPLIGRHIKTKRHRLVPAASRFRVPPPYKFPMPHSLIGAPQYFSSEAITVPDGPLSFEFYNLKERPTYISDDGELFLTDLPEEYLKSLYELFEYEDPLTHIE